MPQYILRDLPDDWGQVKARAEQDGWPMRPLILQLLRDYAAGRIQPSVPPPPPRSPRP